MAKAFISSLLHSTYFIKRLPFANRRSIYDIKNYSAKRSSQLFLHIPEVICNIPDFLSFIDIIAHLGLRIKKAL
jgi:hypothetical protein